MIQLYYFAYGSNMSVRRLQARTTTARLAAHRLQFRKRGHDGSAKCDIEHTCQSRDYVFGIVYSLAPGEKAILDQIEGLGRGYEIKHIRALSEEDKFIQAFAYYATDIDDRLMPYHWYKSHVISGARENCLPRDYISTIEQFRHRRELSIYKS